MGVIFENIFISHKKREAFWIEFMKTKKKYFNSVSTYMKWVSLKKEKIVIGIALWTGT